MASDPAYRILLVCTGNTCRSPLAAAALAKELEAEVPRVHVSSAGIAAWEGNPASELSQVVGRANSLVLSGHRSRRLTAGMLAESDLVLVMERSHLAGARALGADPSRTFVISDWPPPGNPGEEVVDPYGGSMEAYEECWRRIRRHVERIAPAVRAALRPRSV